MSENIFRIIGLASRAGKAEVGEAKAQDRIKYKKAKLIIISSDASDNTKKKFKALCQGAGVEYLEIGNREILGRFAGRESAVVLSISDENFANGIKQYATDIENI
ncbi:MAG: ribosomal L7Ae/L30e/S12e/Gadd45 family protein [Clostridia bacterium]|nr:ribosomal L7Ae/L30e/S12e/Gadd45 family protein [Clostridia bacterium]